MSQTINRMYDSPERANQAADELINNRFQRFPEVRVFTRGGPETPLDDIVASLVKGYVLRAHARVFAEGIKRGGALVSVHAPFGSAVLALEVLDKYDPIDSGVADVEDRPFVWDDAAPCSSAFRLRVLLNDSATFSRFWNVAPLLKKGATTSASLGLPESSGSRGPFSGTFRMPLLSDKGTMLSSMLGLPLLKARR